MGLFRIAAGIVCVRDATCHYRRTVASISFGQLRLAYTGARTFAWMALFLLAGTANAIGNKPWEEYGKLLETRRSVAALDADKMFGEELDLYSGSLSFTATDISLRGNSSLPVELRRKFEVVDTEKQGRTSAPLLGDWQLDLPHISGIFSTNHGWHTDRCSQASPPSVTVPGTPSATLGANEYWAGNHAFMPGGGEMLRPGSSSWPRPQTSTNYAWVTASSTYFSCIGIGAGGEGFLAITADGTTYRFDHMATQQEKALDFSLNGVSGYLQRIRVSLYATLVTDRFGNTLTYTYTNAANQPVRLSKIASRIAGTSTDDRVINLLYDGTGNLQQATADGQTWTYGYTNNSLSSVTLPDLSKWEIGFASLATSKINYSSGDSRRCQSRQSIIGANEYSGWLKHPSGAKADYVIGPKMFGRSRVPLICKNYQYPGVQDPNGTDDDYPVVAIRGWQLTLLSRQITGVGIPTSNWTYEWMAGPGSWGYPPGQSDPVCQTETCLEALCSAPSCAASRSLTIRGPDDGWTRHRYGSTYRYNEGQLLSIATGKGSTTLRTVAHTYDYGTAAQAYAPKIGTSPQSRGAGWVSEAVRPKISTVTMQDGAEFAWTVNKNCVHPDAYCLDAFGRPTRVTRAGTVAQPQQGATISLPPLSIPTVSSPASSLSGAYTVTWSQAGGATSYELQERQGTVAWSSIYNGGGTSHAVSARMTGDWSYRVRACNAAGCTGYSAVVVTQVELTPAGVPVLSAPSTNSSGLYVITWSEITHAVDYEIEESSNGGAWFAIGSRSVPNLTVQGRPNGTYSFRARACNQFACSDFSNAATTVVSLVITQAPTLSLQASIGPTTTVNAWWTSVPGATAYRLERNRNGRGWTTSYNNNGTAMSESFSLHGAYEYRVRGYNGSNLGPYSNTVYLNVPQNTDGGGGEEDE